ncbi:MAG: N-acetylmuramic acid 6-phosphate etherase [Acidobacteriaceae bacterium]
MSKIANLLTEARNPTSQNIDQLSTPEMLQIINAADREIASAVEQEIPNIAKAVDLIAERFEQGGHLFYIGAGTSGRLGVLDASECPPTFSVAPELVQGIIAGGDYALRNAIESAEDDPELGAADLRAHGFTAKDVLVGIASSGRTPYVLGAVEYARSLGAVTVGLSCVPDSELAHACEIAITPAAGPEILTGSTRMKAGTATKLALNMISTGVMIRTGLVYGNLMVNVKPTNAKLVDRAQRIIAEATGVDQATAARLLEEAGSVKTAIVMQKLKLDRAAAEQKLAAAKGRIREALNG